MALKKFCTLLLAGLLSLACLSAAMAEGQAPKPSPQQALLMLKAGNARFLSGKPLRKHQDPARLQLAGIASQAEHAYATVLSCSDSRVPVETIFDAGIMDIFVVRVAGNVVKTDEAGSIEYGLAHVDTPLLVVLGHTKCGAVEAATAEVQGLDLVLERNIPPLLAPILPAVRTAMEAHPKVQGAAIVPYAIEQNVWQAINDLFLQSPATRQLVASKQVMVKGAIYNLASGKVHWLPQDKVAALLKKAEKDPHRALEAMAPTK